MRLADLLGVDSDSQVTGFAIDHRKVAPGTVFGAFQGTRFNGEDFISAAVASGAVAVVTRPGVTVEGAVQVAEVDLVVEDQGGGGEACFGGVGPPGFAGEEVEGVEVDEHQPVLVGGVTDLAAARLALLSDLQPDLSTFGPVGFYLANRIGVATLFVLGVVWPALVGVGSLGVAYIGFRRRDRI